MQNIQIVDEINESTVAPVISLHRSVFGDAKEYSQASLWISRLASDHSSGVIVYHPDGFIALINRAPTLHLWLAGVKEGSRGSGLFKALVSAGCQHYQDTGVEFTQFSLTTFPEKFPVMYGWAYSLMSNETVEASDGKVRITIPIHNLVNWIKNTKHNNNNKQYNKDNSSLIKLLQ